MNKVDEKGIIYVDQPRVPTVSLVISLFSLLLISLGAVSIFALQKPVAETQQVTSQAAVQSGPVTISSSQSPSTFYNSQANTVDLNINTKGLQTTGVTSVFTVVTDTSDSLNVEVLSSSNLRSTSQEVQKTTTGFIVKVVAVPAGTGPFSSTTALPFLRLTFNPHGTGSFNIIWDQVYSHVYLTSNNSTEELGFAPQMSFVIANNPSATANTAVVNQRACNQECANNAQCKTGLMCFDNRCRQPGNPDSTVCANVTQITYNGLVKSCNVACTSNKQCDINLRCYNGTCRLASNPSSSSCTPSTVPVITSTYPSVPAATPNPLAGEKGEVIVVPTATPSASPFVWPTPSPITQVKPTPAAVYQTEVPTDIQSSSNPLTNFLNQLRAQSSASSLSFPIIAVIAGVVLLIVALLLLIRRSTRPPKVSLPPAAPLNPRPASTEEQSLEKRIAQLKSQEAVPAAPDDVVVPPTSLTLQSAPVPQFPQSSENSNTMMQRIKEKGLNPDPSKLPNPTDSDQKK